jgi:hypothetical protein
MNDTSGILVNSKELFAKIFENLELCWMFYEIFVDKFSNG